MSECKHCGGDHKPWHCVTHSVYPVSYAKSYESALEEISRLQGRVAELVESLDRVMQDGSEECVRAEQAEAERDALARKIRFCDHCGGNWVDDGNQADCYCRLIARLRAERDALREALDTIRELTENLEVEVDGDLYYHPGTGHAACESHDIASKALAQSTQTEQREQEGGEDDNRSTDML